MILCLCFISFSSFFVFYLFLALGYKKIRRAFIALRIVSTDGF
ncbi:hypothetical protein HMPREF1987_02131 [Peptostreptococcaceae bacterium oral taxon 113 str. W5053]|nr:hypothetical protein HMPREF1987_02131 [Peptostreptococcaceae bacterium oral taxon 113 str. W5053]